VPPAEHDGRSGAHPGGDLDPPLEPVDRLVQTAEDDGEPPQGGREHLRELRRRNLGTTARGSAGHRPAEAGLLDIDAHPAMSFSCDDVRPDGSGWCAADVLGLRGTSCPLTVTGTVDGSTSEALHVVGTATLDRTAIGIGRRG
jgi:hypothetical protein